MPEAPRAAMRSTDTLEPFGTERTRRAHSRIVMIAEDHVLSRVAERVHVSDLCRAAEHGSTQVSVDALKWGFWHFGEFSRAYKQCFGELPSDTLRRRTER